MPDHPDREGLFRRARSLGGRAIRRLGIPRNEGSNLIRAWSGIVDPGARHSRHLAPLQAQLESGTPHEREFEFFASLEGVGWVGR